MKRNRRLMILLILCLVLGLTNPGQEQHERAVYARTEALIANMGQQAAGLLGRLAAGILARIATEAVDTLDLGLFSYHNYVLFSTMELDGQMVSVGIVGRVLVSADYGVEDVVLALLRSPQGGGMEPTLPLSELVGDVLGYIPVN